MTDKKITLEFNDRVVRQFLLASVIWGAVAMLVGVLIALQLNFWQLNFATPWLTWSRIRPLHTNAAIFALVGNMMFAGVYYSTQRLVKARLASDFLSQLHFWGWQAIIVSAALTLPFGFTRGQE
jgi:cytochrome c oxidase cbb3-type subunit I/II